MRARIVLCFFLLAPVLGCGGAAKRVDPERTLPFTVKLKNVTVEPEKSAERFKKLDEATTPALFNDPQRLEKITRHLARSLKEAGLFTRLVTEEEDPVAATDADLELDIEVRDYDFGEGQPTVTGAIFSTLAWLFAGHASWFIDNREYPDSRVILRVTLSDAAEPEATPFRHDLFLKGMQLNFLERSGTANWFLSILVPPWIGGGDPVIAGESLAERSAEFFMENEPQQILSSFPSDYFRRQASFLGYYQDSDGKDWIAIISSANLERVTIRAESRTQPRQLESLSFETTGEVIDELYRSLAQRYGAGFTPNDRYYRIPLEADESGFVRVEAMLEGIETPSRWTIERKASPALLAAGG